MAYISHKQVRGYTYRYLIESYRNSQGQPRQKTQSFGAVPVLAEDAPIGVVLFAGGGGVECGMVMAGIRPVISVESDPTKPELSKALARSNHLNFKPYGSRVIKRTVQQVAAAKFPDFPRSPDYLHASPVCANFSQMKTDKGEADVDREAACAVAQAITQLKPRCFTLENVTAYQNSDSWYFIEQSLKAEGYKIAAAVLDASDYGVPQARKRFIVKAVREGVPTFPAKSRVVGWYEVLADLMERLPDSQLLPDQQRAIDAKLAVIPSVEALLIERIGFRKVPQLREPSEPVWTLKRSIFTDHNQNNRNRFIDIWLADGRVKALNIEAVRRLQSFPQWYVLPAEINVAGSLLGYSVPPILLKKLLLA